MKEINHIGDAVAASLKKSASVIEELQLQASLGKAEAIDKFEEVKSGLKQLIEKSRLTYFKEKSKLEGLKTKLEHLELQLALGKAETKDTIYEQKQNLLAAIRDVERIIAK